MENHARYRVIAAADLRQIGSFLPKKSERPAKNGAIIDPVRPHGGHLAPSNCIGVERHKPTRVRYRLPLRALQDQDTRGRVAALESREQCGTGSARTPHPPARPCCHSARRLRHRRACRPARPVWPRSSPAMPCRRRRLRLACFAARSRAGLSGTCICTRSKSGQDSTAVSPKVAPIARSSPGRMKGS